MTSWLCCCCQSHDDEQLRGLNDDVGTDTLALPVFAAMWCRSSGKFALEKTLEQIGTRQRKSFCWVTMTSDSTPSSSSMLSWLYSSGSRCALSVSVCTVGLHERYHVERVLQLSSHPLLMPILGVEFVNDRIVVVREWCSGGSLRDLIHGVSPAKSVHSKYDRIGSPLSEAKCASLGRGILDALLVLRPLGARACLHVHPGNIFLLHERLVVSEWEQGLLGLPSHLADFVNDLKRALEPAAATLALCLYEMACGFELDGLPAVFPPTCPRAVRDTLEVMLRAPAPKERKPPRTLEELLGLPLFTLSEARNAAWARGASAPQPLSDVALRHAGQVTSARGDPSSHEPSATFACASGSANGIGNGLNAVHGAAII